MSTIQTELCIIGAGSGGLSLAAAASQLGIEVTLIEKGTMGGDCLNTGCVPSKALLSAAKHHWQIVNPTQTMGTEVKHFKTNFSAVMQHVHDAIKTIAPHDSVERFEDLGCRVIKGEASFIDAQSLSVDGEKTIRAKKYVLATGSKPSVPMIKGLENCKFWTNENIFQIETLPKHLVIIGGGVIACELGQAFAMLGGQVTLLVRDKLLARTDQDGAIAIKQQLLNMGVTVLEHAQIESVSQVNHRTVIELRHQGEEKIIMGSQLMVAAGRTPDYQNLEVERAGIKVNDKGIIVDKRLRTSNKNVYAIGDVIGDAQFTHIANYHAGQLVRHLFFRLPINFHQAIVPSVIYTSPEVAQAGLTEACASQQHQKIRVLQSEFKGNDRAVAEGIQQGKIKLVVTQKRAVLGVTIISQNAGELILPWQMVIQHKLSLRKITDLIIPYPTLSEIHKRVAGDFFKDKLFSPTVKRLVSWLKRC